ncbi:MAG: hypothetical protein OXG08_13650 [Gammaproteobacteria bacterium]|nr:hypothetical protein [Gammaproteobacteria bacterium]
MQLGKHVPKILSHVLPWFGVCMFLIVAWQSTPFDRVFAVVNAATAVAFAILHTWQVFSRSVNPPDDLPQPRPTGKPATRPTGWLYRVPPSVTHPW